MSREIVDPYIIAEYQSENGFPAWINYYPVPHHFGGAEPLVTVFYGNSPSRPQGPCLEPARMLEWVPGIYRIINRDGKRIEVKDGNEPSGWFRRQSETAGCLWFYGLVERMAAGEEIPIEEIKAAYRENNGGKDLVQKPIYEMR